MDYDHSCVNDTSVADCNMISHNYSSLHCVNNPNDHSHAEKDSNDHSHVKKDSSNRVDVKKDSDNHGRVKMNPDDHNHVKKESSNRRHAKKDSSNHVDVKKDTDDHGDDHINAINQLLYDKFKDFQGLSTPLLGLKLSFPKFDWLAGFAGFAYFQILHTGEDHWITIKMNSDHEVDV